MWPAVQQTAFDALSTGLERRAGTAGWARHVLWHEHETGFYSRKAGWLVRPVGRARCRLFRCRDPGTGQHRLGGRAVVSHQSAVLLHGVEVTDLDLSRVHVTRLAGHGNSRESVCQHAARPPVVDPVEVGRVRVTPGPRSVVEAIRYTSYGVAVSVVDAALRQGVATAEQLSDALELFSNRTGIRAATRAVGFGDGRSESVGESRLRVILADLGLPEPILQPEIRDAAGQLVARVDFLLARWVWSSSSTAWSSTPAAEPMR